jgi:hypothetical protein
MLPRHARTGEDPAPCPLQPKEIMPIFRSGEFFSGVCGLYLVCWLGLRKVSLFPIYSCFVIVTRLLNTSVNSWSSGCPVETLLSSFIGNKREI